MMDIMPVQTIQFLQNELRICFKKLEECQMRSCIRG